MLWFMLNKLKKYHKDFEILKNNTHFYMTYIIDIYKINTNQMCTSTESQIYFDSINGFVDIFLCSNIFTVEAFIRNFSYNYAR